MSLLSDVPFPNLTIYRTDYTKKEQKRTEPYRFESEYKNVIAGTLEEDGLLGGNCSLLENRNSSPEYKEKICERSVAFSKALKDDFDCSKIRTLYEKEGMTEYMVAYSRLGDYQSKKFRSTRSIPEDWTIEETTHRCVYKPPLVLAGGKLPEVEVKRMVDHLKPNEKNRAILGVKTGETEYMACIHKTGEEIIQGKLHGDVNIRPQFSQDELLRAMLIRRD